MHMANERYQQNSHKWQTWPPLTAGLPGASERYWASFQVTRLFHKATVSQCDHFFIFLLLHMYLLFETSPVFFFLTSIWCGSTQLQCIYYLRHILISRPRMVSRRFKRRSCLSCYPERTSLWWMSVLCYCIELQVYLYLYVDIHPRGICRKIFPYFFYHCSDASVYYSCFFFILSWI